jgi:hypothetical protein
VPLLLHSAVILYQKQAPETSAGSVGTSDVTLTPVGLQHTFTCPPSVAYIPATPSPCDCSLCDVADVEDDTTSAADGHSGE